MKRKEVRRLEKQRLDELKQQLLLLDAARKEVGKRLLDRGLCEAERQELKLERKVLKLGL